MVNISVFSPQNIDVEGKEYHIEEQDDMIQFLNELLTKIKYSGETVQLAKATIEENEVQFEEINRW